MVLALMLIRLYLAAAAVQADVPAVVFAVADVIAPADASAATTFKEHLSVCPLDHQKTQHSTVDTGEHHSTVHQMR